MTETVQLTLNREQADVLAKILAQYDVRILAGNLQAVDFQAKAIHSMFESLDDAIHYADWCDSPNCVWKKKHDLRRT